MRNNNWHNRLRKYPTYNNSVCGYIIPPNIKLGVNDYRYVLNLNLTEILRRWPELLNPIYKGEEIIDGAYQEVVEGIERLRKINLNRGKKDKQIKKVLKEDINFYTDKNAVYDLDWWGQVVSDEVKYEILNEIDNLIAIISKKDKTPTKQYLNNYIKSFKEKWQK